MVQGDIRCLKCQIVGHLLKILLFVFKTKRVRRTVFVVRRFSSVLNNGLACDPHLESFWEDKKA